MSSKMTPFSYLCILIISFWINACTPDLSSKGEDQIISPSHILISEILAGGSGNNNLEFIELYNDGGELMDVEGWELVYRLPTSEEALPVFIWENSALIAPYGHLLLVRSGQDFGLSPDGYFDQGLNTAGGGLGLRNAEGKLVDSVAWGKGAPALGEGSPAPALQDDQSLQRKPAAGGASLHDSDDNASDFTLNPAPDPRNVTSVFSSDLDPGLRIVVSAPAEVQPGSAFTYTITIENRGSEELKGLVVQVPLPEALDLMFLPAGWSRDDSLLLWELDSLEQGGLQSSDIEVQAPWVYGTVGLRNALGRSTSMNVIALAPTHRTEVSGGAIPVAIARTLINQVVIVEGIATMYTDGLFAGSTGTKFYIDDGTAGAQVYVADGMGVVNVPIGARVRVEGEVQLYRGALELVPGTPELVEVLELDSGVVPIPEEVSIRQAANDLETLPGNLVEVQGTLMRAEEFSYSYELDLVDEEGQLLTAYIDKLTNATIETLDVGETYQVTGVMEVLDGTSILYPRQAEDLVRIYQPIVYLGIHAPSAVDFGEAFTITLSAENHTDQTLTDVTLWANKPGGDVSLLEVLNAGGFQDERLTWSIPELPGEGGRVEVQYRLRMQPGTESYTLTAIGLETQAAIQTSDVYPARIFHGGIVPLWAIQGDGMQSPYRLNQVTTTGVVTGVFPEFGGFWIQSEVGDGDPTTSEGLFIFDAEHEPDVSTGSLVYISGQVREISGQTQLLLATVDQIQILSQDKSLPDPVALDPPANLETAAQYYEALEGMLVEVNQPARVVGPTSRYGETFLVPQKHGVNRVLRGEETGWMIVIDDGSDAIHYDQTTMPVALAVGDSVEHAYGPLAFTFGAYKIEPLDPPLINPSEHMLPSIEIVEAPDFSIMTWNVENLFDILEPHPNDSPRPRRAEYELTLTKIAATIVSGGAPTVIGLQEVENIKVLKDLSEHELLSDFDYTAVLVEGTDSRGIDVGYLLRSNQVKVLSYRQFPAPEGLTSRPPLLVHLKLLEQEAAFELYVLNNHFTSMSGGVEATEPRRNEQALWNTQVMGEIQRQDPDANIIVLGDLNSFIDSLPVESLRLAGLRHVYEIDPGQRWYSYIYQGASQTLDHILVTPELFEMLSNTVTLHTNADYPPPPAGDTSPMHISDHDPVIAFFAP